MILFTLGIVLLFAIVPFVLETSGQPGHAFYVIMMILTFAILAFFFWPLYTTYYTLTSEGVHVRYGPWQRLHPWSDFKRAFWQKGVFATRIGWPSITPCVRFSNCVQLQRKRGWFPLYLTPNDPRAFLTRMTEFAPELTKEAIL